MNMPPEPPAEGVLIESARTAARLSVREAARRAGISEGWWRQVVKGYQSLSGGAYGIVRDVPAGTVARMASAAGVSPEQMETAGQRPDAAEAMRQEQQRRAIDVDAALERGPRDFPQLDPATQALVEPHFEAIRAQVRQAIMDGADLPVPKGAQVFRDAWEQQRWDRLVVTGRDVGEFSLWELMLVMATGRARDEAARQQGRAAGLILAHG